MITLSDINDKIIADYLAEQSYSLYSVRIKALLKAYGGYKGLIDVWYQIKDNVTAYIVRYGGEFIADLLPGADVEEIINLCKMAGGTALLCSPVYNEYNSILGAVMSVNPPLLHSGSFCSADYSFTPEVNPTDYYSLLLQCNGAEFKAVSYEDFVADLSHRMRKDTAVLMGCYLDSRLISCAAATAVYKGGAVIAGVATLPSYRKKGLATAVVTLLCKKLFRNGVEKIYLQRDKNKNYSLYNNIGFENIGDFQQVELP